MKAIIKTQDGVSTLKLDIDFNQILDDNFEEICKAIAVRGQVLKELVTIAESNNKLIETVVQIIRSSSSEEEAVSSLSKELDVSIATAKYLADIRLDELSSLNMKDIRQKYEKYKKTIESL